MDNFDSSQSDTSNEASSPGWLMPLTAGSEMMRAVIDHILRADLERSVAELMQIREMLEPEIAACAAELATPQILIELKTEIETMANAICDAEACVRADQRFHQALAAATGNELLLQITDLIEDLLLQQRLQIFQAGVDNASRGLHHHKRIFHAIASGNPNAARQEMTAHLKQVRADCGISLS